MSFKVDITSKTYAQSTASLANKHNTLDFRESSPNQCPINLETHIKVE